MQMAGIHLEADTARLKILMLTRLRRVLKPFLALMAAADDFVPHYVSTFGPSASTSTLEKS